MKFRTTVKLRTPLSVRLERDWKRNKYIYIMIAPVIAFFLMFKYYPMTWLSISLYDFKLLKGFAGSKFVGLKNYVDFFTARNFWQLFNNTVVFNFWAIIYQSLAPIILALLLNEVRKNWLKRTIQTISFLPYFISTVIIVAMIISFLSPSMGIINRFLKSMGKESKYFLGMPEYFRGINYVSGVWQMMGWNSIVYISALTAVDQEMYEAAIVDGASRVQRLWHITIPSIKTTIAIMLTLNMGNLMSANVEKILLLQNDLNLSVSELLPTFVYKMGMINSKYSYATTAGLFTSVVSCTLVIITNVLSQRLSDSEIGVF